MIATGVVNRNDFELALRAAAALGEKEPLMGLAAPLDGTWLGRIGEAWDKVEAALREAYLRGREAAEVALADAIAHVEGLMRSAGRQARDIHEALLERAQACLTVLVRSALVQVQGVLDVGGTQLKLVSVEVAQTISLSGSMKASLTELVALTGAGEVSVSASHGS